MKTTAPQHCSCAMQCNLLVQKTFEERKYTFLVKFLHCSDTAEPNEYRLCTNFVNACLVHTTQKAAAELPLSSCPLNEKNNCSQEEQMGYPSTAKRKPVLTNANIHTFLAFTSELFYNYLFSLEETALHNVTI